MKIGLGSDDRKTARRFVAHGFPGFRPAATDSRATHGICLTDTCQWDMPSARVVLAEFQSNKRWTQKHSKNRYSRRVRCGSRSTVKTSSPRRFWC